MNRLINSSWAVGVISLLLALAIFTTLQFKSMGVFADPDGFYHAKVSQLLQHGQLQASFPWLPYTTWSGGFADQHYLYHLLLIPFNSAQALPISVVVFSLMFVALFLLTLKKLNVPGSIWWTALLLLGSVDFLFRINLVKANTLSLVLMLSMILLLVAWHQKKSKALVAGMAVVSFVFVWTYGGFVFLPLIVGAYGLAILIADMKIDLISSIAMIAGITLGLVLHPHAYNVLQSLNNQLFQTGLGAGTAVPAGTEWLSYNPAWFIKSNVLVLFVWSLSLIVIAKKFTTKIGWQTLWPQILAVLFFVLAIWHRRFIEYFVPFAVLASSITLAPYLMKIKWVDVKNAFAQHWQFRAVAAVVTLVIATTFWWNFNQVSILLNDGSRFDAYQSAAKAISEASQPGDMVINTQWDQFPQLWYWNSKNSYIAGMDPTFFYLQDPEKYWDWRKIADDDSAQWGSVEELHSIVRQTLKAKFVFIDNDRNPNLYQFIQDNDLDQRYFKSLMVGGNSLVFEALSPR